MTLAYYERAPSKRFLAFKQAQERRTQRMEAEWERLRLKREHAQQRVNARLERLDAARQAADKKKLDRAQTIANNAAAYVYRLTRNALATEKRRALRPLLSTLRSRMNNALRKVKSRKCDHTCKLLGCSLLRFKLYMEKKFKPGMSWDNHGYLWHIDHVRPCCSFDLSQPKEQRKCFNYRNLQPLFAGDNLSKGGRWP